MLMPTAYENILKLIEDAVIYCAQVLGISAPASGAFINNRIISLIKRGEISHDQAFDISSYAVAAFRSDKTYHLIQLEVISINDALAIQPRQLNMINNLHESYLIYKLLKDRVISYERFKKMRGDETEAFRRVTISDAAIAAFKSENILQLIDNGHISYRRVFDMSDAELSLIDSDSIVQLILVDNASCDQVLKMSNNLSQVLELLDIDTGNRYSDAASQAELPDYLFVLCTLVTAIVIARLGHSIPEILQAELQKYLLILGALLTVIATAWLGLAMLSGSSENDQLIFIFFLSFFAIGALSLTGYQNFQSISFFQPQKSTSSNNPITEIFNVTLEVYKSYVLELIQNDQDNTMDGAFTLCFLALMSDPISNHETILACLDHIIVIDSTLSAIVLGILASNFSNDELSMNPIFEKINQKCPDEDEDSQRIFRKIAGQESIMGVPSKFSMYGGALPQQRCGEQDESLHLSYP